MKNKIIGIITAAAIAVVSCGVMTIAAAENTENLIVNGDFEAALLGSGNSWGFTQTGGWFVGTNGGTGEVSMDEYHGGVSSLKVSDSTVGQRVTLQSGYKYTLTAYVKGTAGASAKVNLDDGTNAYPDSDSGIIESKVITLTADWQPVTLQYTCTATQAYVICLESWDGSNVYFDDVTLTGEEQEYESGGITNGNFAEGMSAWTEAGDGSAAADGMLTMQCSGEEYRVYQIVTDLQDGVYNLSVTAKVSGKEDIAYVYAKPTGRTMASTAIPATVAAGSVVVPGIRIENGTCEIGICAKNTAEVTADDFVLSETPDTHIDFLKGGEISKLTYVEDMGAKFYRADGTEGDALQIMAENGFNLARIRILDDPGKGHGEPDYYLPADYMTEEDCLRMARRAKDKGMQILFSFAYSDYWVDGEKQYIPHRWNEEIAAKGLSGEAMYQYLEDKTYSYTKDIMEKLIAQGTCPEYVSIGNEIQVGLFFGNQKTKSPFISALYNNADMLARFLNAGAKAVRDTSPSTKIILHSDNGGKLSQRNTFKSALSKVGANYDVIGVSYYPYYNADVSIDTVVNEFKSLISTYNKDVIIMETGYNWNETKPGGWEGQLQNSGYYQNIYGESQEGQRAFLTELYAKLKQVSGGRCIGDCYWDPIMIHDDEYKIGWAIRESDDGTDSNVVPNSTIFDFDGKAVEGQLAMKYNVNSSDKLLISGKVTNGAAAASGMEFTLAVNGEAYTVVTDKFGDYILSVPYPECDTVTVEINGADAVEKIIPHEDFMLMSVDFDEYSEGLSLTAEREADGKISYIASANVPKDVIDNAALWVALYDGGVLKGVKQTAGGIFEAAHGGSYTVKAFLWDKNMKALYPSREVTAQ